MAHDVFVSYSSIDKIVADAVVASLEKNSIRCWYAPRDIKPGSDWGEEIAKAVNSAPVFLLIFSNNSNRSQRVLDELNLAISNEAAILPFRIENLNPSGAMQLHLSTRHWLDAFVPSWEMHLEKLFRAVSVNLERGNGKESAEGESTFVSPPMPKKKKNRLLAIISFVILIGLGSIFGIPKVLDQIAANDQASLEVTPEPSTVPTLTSTPTITPAPEPVGPALGSAENPIIWMYAPLEDANFEEINLAAVEIAQIIGEMNDGLIIKFMPATTEASIVAALCDGQAHIGSLNAYAYLRASNEKCAEVKMVWSAFEDIKYRGEIFFNANNENIISYQDLEGKTLCIPNFSSASGWVLPSLEIRATYGDPFTFFGEIIEIGSHPGVLESVYYGNCDAGSAFYDVREGSDLPDVMNIVEIIFTTISMPQLNVSFQSDLDPIISQQLITSLISISSENIQLAILNGISYQEGIIAEHLVEINDYYYDELRDLFERSGENIEDYQ